MRLALLLQPLDGALHVAARAAPADHQQVALSGACDLLTGQIVGHGRHFGGARAHHLLMVGGFVGDASLQTMFFESADAVFETGLAGKAQPRTWRASRA